MNEVVPQTLPLRDSQPVDTSGTVGTTIVDAITLIEHAARRAGVQPTSMTPENLEMGKKNLGFVLSKLATRGLNLWAVEQFYLPVVEGKARYALPTGTEGIVNVVQRRTQRLPGLATLTGSTAVSVLFTAISTVRMIGFKLEAEIYSRFVFEYTVDGTNWAILQNFDDITLSAGWHWYGLEVPMECIGVRLRNSEDKPLTVLDMLATSYVSDLPLTRINRDEYAELNDKFRPGEPTLFFFEKKIESALTFWPTGASEESFFVVWRHRLIQDVGSLSSRIEIPDRWYDSVIWMLAKPMAFELPNVADVRLNLCIQEAEKAESYSELGETDGSSTWLRPNISGYTC